MNRKKCTLGLYLLLAVSSISAQSPLQFYEADSAVTVTAFREATPTHTAPFSLSRINFGETPLVATPAVDEILEHTPGFSLFRRSSSAIANPTIQGVSLRGIGPSGASRSLVLWQGLPLNDAFGGWVYWSRVNTAALERVEIVRGGGSSIYGSSPISGTIQFLPDTSPHTRLHMQSHSTGAYDLSASVRQRLSSGLDFSINGKTGKMGNFYKIPKSRRGQVDRRANAGYNQLAASLRLTQNRWMWQLRGTAFDEQRNNGTRVQKNDTRLYTLENELMYQMTPQLSFEWQTMFHTQKFNQTFSAVSENRNSERLVRAQHVPSRMWASEVIGRFQLPAHRLQLGLSFNQKQGVSHETSYWNGAARSLLDVGGRQRNGGIYVQDQWQAENVNISASLRYDWLQNSQTDSLFTPLAGGSQILGARPHSSKSLLSPRLSASWNVLSSLKLRGAAYRSFRSPTLNELYRGYRVGDVVTSPNSRLTPEFVTGVELGLDVYLPRADVSITWFQMNLQDAISNATLDVTESLILRQRQNVGAVRSRGLELQGNWHITPTFYMSGNYVFTDSKITDAADKQLVGNQTPQVPTHSGYIGIGYNFSKLIFLIDLQHQTKQFDDDLNRFALAGFTQIDVQLSYNLLSGVRLSLGARNLLDTEVEIARTPELSVGQPRIIFVALDVSRPREKAQK